MVNQQHRALISTTIIALAALALVIALELTSNIDREISDRFFDPSGAWLVDHRSSGLRLWLYDGAKILIILFGIGMLGIVCWPRLARPGGITRREALFVLACLAAVPLAVGVIKKYSNVQCPASLQRYGGTQSDDDAHIQLTGFFETHRNSGCWPSGHSSGGFALLCVAWLGRGRCSRLRLAVPGLVAGFLTGAYQVARGAHFASHVLVTGLISIIVIALLAYLFETGETTATG
jgi:membrane-associated PAP2 superfamily phosphatase